MRKAAFRRTLVRSNLVKMIKDADSKFNDYSFSRVLGL